MQLKCAMLYVRDLRLMKEFYARLFQVEPAETDPPNIWALFETGGSQFALHAIPPEVVASLPSASLHQIRDNAPMRLIFAVEDPATERTRLQAIGMTVFQCPWQTKSSDFLAADPEGNVIQIVSKRK